MSISGHLRIEELRLGSGEEWVDTSACWRFVRLASGVAYWLDTASPRAFIEGELLVVAPPIKAVVRASQLSQVVLHYFTYAPDLLSEFLTPAEREFFHHEAFERLPAVQFLPSTHQLTVQFVAILDRRSLPALLERAELLSLVAAFFSGAIPERPAAKAPSLSAQDRFWEIISQMPDSELIQHTPEQLAALCGCTTRHFNRLFHESFGMSPRARQTDLRLLRAAELLRKPEAKIRDVSLESGYRSLSLFNSLFKRRFGMSPSQWRRDSARRSSAD